jgi:hypothetical protein
MYGFQTTAPNAVVEPIHPKAMPVTHPKLRGMGRSLSRPARCGRPIPRVTLADTWRYRGGHVRWGRVHWTLEGGMRGPA